MRDWFGPRNPGGPFPELLGLLIIAFGYMGKELRLLIFGCATLIFCSCCLSMTLVIMALILRSR